MFLNSKKLTWILSIIIPVLLVFIIYSPVYSAQFVWDDPDFIVNWKLIRNLNNVPQFMMGALPNEHEGVYRPLRSIIQAVDYSLYRQQPFPYHVQAVTVHAIAVALVFIIAAIVFKKPLPAFLSAMFFALHPVQSESVAFISAGFDTLGMVFLLASVCLFLTFHSFVHKFKFDPRILLVISYLFAGMAFMTTELTLSLPILLFGFIVFHYRYHWKKTLIHIFPYIVLAFAYWTVRMNVITPGERLTGYINDSVYLTVLTMAKVFLTYCIRIIFPLQLISITTISPGITNIVVSPEAVAAQKITDISTILGLLTLTGLIATGVYSLKKNVHISLFLFLFFAGLAPVSYIIPGGAFYAERYVYVSMLGLSLLFSFISMHIFNWQGQKKDYIRGITVTVLTLVFILYGIRTFIRAADYQTPLKFWLANAVVEPKEPAVLNNLALEFAKRGMIQDADKTFKIAEHYGSDYTKAFYNHSSVLREYKQTEQALYPAARAFELAPAVGDYAINYATLLSTLGKYDDAQQTLATAAGEFYASDPEIWYVLGNISIRANDYETAESALLQSITIDPTYLNGYINLAAVYNREGTPSAAIEVLTKAEKLHPESIQAANLYYNLAVSYKKMNQLDKAKEAIDTAFRSNVADEQVRKLREELFADTKK